MAIEPFYRPRRLTEKAQLRRYKTGRSGDCYAYAFREIMAWCEAGKPAPTMAVVHGTIDGHGHAWIERGGFAYDWQTFALRGSEPMPLAVFYERFEPEERTTYNAQDIAANVLRESHHGPWKEEG